jgi:predicted Holliday junction resolvase-like endonuclease
MFEETEHKILLLLLMMMMMILIYYLYRKCCRLKKHVYRFEQQIRNTWKVFKCGAGEGWSRSVVQIM